MKLNARGEVTQKYRKAALLDRELERGNEEEKNLQADAVAHEARVAAAARQAGRRRRLVGDDLRRVTLAFDGRAAGAPTAALGAAFELTLPKSYDVVPMKRASGAVGPPGVDEIVEEHALTDTRAALDAKSLPRCEIARAE